MAQQIVTYMIRFSSQRRFQCSIVTSMDWQASPQPNLLHTKKWVNGLAKKGMYCPLKTNHDDFKTQAKSDLKIILVQSEVTKDHIRYREDRPSRKPRLRG